MSVALSHRTHSFRLSPATYSLFSVGEGNTRDICDTAAQPAQEDATPAAPAARKKARKTAPGRPAGGPACIGCAHYQPRQPQPWTFNGIGDCQARGIEVRSSRRYACPRYEFHAANRPEQAQ
jgi:hypothetical protein